MNLQIKLIVLLLLVGLWSCGSGSEKATDSEPPQSMVEEPADPYANWENNNGVGPISSLELPAEIDQAMAEEGKSIYETKCTLCHKLDKKFIGPSPKGIYERRTAAWTMNMILNPEEMVQKDPIAKQLLIDYNGSPMANQNLTQEEARAVVEYFRTL